MSWHIPVKTDHMRRESQHEPSMSYAQDIHSVASQMPAGFSALEIGAAWGFSTLAILEAGAGSLMSVDSNSRIKAPAEVEANGYTDKYAWSCSRSDKFWDENPDVRYDLIYIDGSHRYEDVKNDLEQALIRLKLGGMLLVDDWDHPKNIQSENNTVEYGVSLACWEFWRDNARYLKAGIQGRVLWFVKEAANYRVTI